MIRVSRFLTDRKPLPTNSVKAVKDKFQYFMSLGVATAYAPIAWEHSALMAVVCLSVCPVPDPKSRMVKHSKLKIDMKEAHSTGDLCPI